QLDRTRFPQQPQDGAGIKLPEAKVQLRNGAGSRGGVGDREDGAAHFLRIRGGSKAASLHAAAADFDNCDVDAVERRAAHDSSYSHGRFSSSCSSFSSCSASMGRSSSTLSERIRSAIWWPTGSNSRIWTGPARSGAASGAVSSSLTACSVVSWS